MPQITRLAIQKKDKERVNVYLDGEFAFGLALIEAVRLKVGQTLSEGEIAALRQEDAYLKSYQRAVDLLARRPRSCREMERYLARKEVPQPHRERIVARLTELGLLDDLAFAQYWVDNREAFRPRSRRALHYELRQKGVDETIIAQALMESEVDEDESAYRIGLRYLPRLRAIEDQRQFQQKLAAHLGRRGYGWSIIRQVSERLWAERDD